MNNSNIEFVVVTFYHDLAQFYILCLSIKKYHDKQHKIKIIYNHSGNLVGIDKFKNIINEHLSNFDIEFLTDPIEITCKHNGWTSQQILKWYLAYNSNAEWQVVLDSKNFYIRPFDIGNLNNAVPGFEIPKNDINNWSNVELARSYEFLKRFQSIPPQKYAAMTPWIWKPKLIKEMLDTVWPDNMWEQLTELPGTEWFLYLSWIGNRVNYFPKQCVTGIWGIGNNADMAYIGLANNTDICFWTKHRFANDTTSISVTKTVLKEFNVATDIEIDNWLAMIEL
jgi:hypothetical protein